MKKTVKKVTLFLLAVNSLFLVFGENNRSTKIHSGSSQVISQIQFRNKGKRIERAVIGDTVRMRAVTENIADRTPAVIHVLEKTRSDDYVEIQKMNACVKGNRISAEWKVKYDVEDHEEHDFCRGKPGREYKCPEYFFVAEIDGCRGMVSGPLRLYANFYARLTFKERTLKDYPYVLKLADGSFRKGKTNRKGMIVEKNVPIGSVVIM